jgi:L-asparaginase II
MLATGPWHTRAMTPPPVLASVWRGEVCEARIRGHVAVVDSEGTLVASLGDPDMVTTVRSCVKPLQALPFVRHALDEVGAGSDELAVACASHSGEEVHVATVTRLLARVGLDESALRCGPQLPVEPSAARKLLASGGEARPIHNNCSGKHAAMLATCVVQGWPTEGYIDADHPCQRAVTDALAWAFGFDAESAPSGIDGCGLPTYGVALATLARGFAMASADPDFRRCQDAMAAHPHMVAGTGRFDTALLQLAGERVTAKIGGAAVWAAVVRPDGPGIALKLESGYDAVAPVAVAVLQGIGVLEPAVPDPLAEFARPPLRNWAGVVVGETKVEADLALGAAEGRWQPTRP